MEKITKIYEVKSGEVAASTGNWRKSEKEIKREIKKRRDKLLMVFRGEESTVMVWKRKYSKLGKLKLEGGNQNDKS